METVRTTTLYINLAASELGTIQASSWLEIPPLEHGLILYAAPGAGQVPSAGDVPCDLGWQSGSLRVQARIQLRSDYLTAMELSTAGDYALEICVPPEGIADLNRNLVGPVVPLQEPLALELLSTGQAVAAVSMVANGHAVPDRIT